MKEKKVESANPYEDNDNNDIFYIVVDDETGNYLEKFSSQEDAIAFGEDCGYEYRIVTEKKKKYSDFYKNKYRK